MSTRKTLTYVELSAPLKASDIRTKVAAFKQSVEDLEDIYYDLLPFCQRLGFHTSEPVFGEMIDRLDISHKKVSTSTQVQSETVIELEELSEEIITFIKSMNATSRNIWDLINDFETDPDQEVFNLLATKGREIFSKEAFYTNVQREQLGVLLKSPPALSGFAFRPKVATWVGEFRIWMKDNYKA